MADEALLVIDVQNDFCPGGALAVEGGNLIVPLINTMMADYAHVLFTQDWHPSDHASFASQHAGRDAFDAIDMDYGSQTLWPDHCVTGSPGARFHPGLDTTRAEMIIRKGFRRQVDSYSAFFENDHATPTGLTGYLRERGITRLTLVGLATDFCVGFSALDTVAQGFSARVVLDACRGIDMEGSVAAMVARMAEAGVDIE